MKKPAGPSPKVARAVGGGVEDGKTLFGTVKSAPKKKIRRY
jgi:hypothetical protein